MAKSMLIFSLTTSEVESLHDSLTSGGQVTLCADDIGVTITLRTKNTVNDCVKCSALKTAINELDKF